MATYFTTLSTENITETNGVQLMPFSIEYEGDAKIKQYFESSIRKEDEGMTASFRGRPIKGETVHVPHGYIGIVMKEARKAITEDDDRHLNGVRKFQKFTYWNLDRNPSGDDKIKQALDWMSIAKVLHGPVDMEDSQKSVVGN